MSEGKKGSSRRKFLATSTAAAVAANMGIISRSRAAGDEAIRVGLVGCGGRGTGAGGNAIAASKNVKIVALADVFDYGEKGVHKAKEEFERVGQKIDPAYIFTGFDGYKKLLALDLDYVILATPPYFRPAHIMAAVQAGKNIFAEKPVAVDPAGCRMVMEAGKIASEKGLSIAAGTQRRHQRPYLELYDRIRNGEIGDIRAARCYWNGGQLWYRERKGQLEKASDMELMLRNWVNWAWLSGDHICEQHVHNLDVVNWFLSKDGTAVHPIRAVGMGGRARRVNGDQFDFFSVDYEYEGGLHVASQCRQVNGCDNNVTEQIVGTTGSTHSEQSGRCLISGSNAWRYDLRNQKYTDPYTQEHIDLIDSIKGGSKKLNEANNVATSTLTAIMGRIAAYTGKPVTWDEVMSSSLKLGPKEVNMEVALLPEKVPVPGTA